jgi:hypothetical protein
VDAGPGLGQSLEDGPVAGADRADAGAELEQRGVGSSVADQPLPQVHHHGREQVGFGREVPEHGADRDAARAATASVDAAAPC